MCYSSILDLLSYYDTYFDIDRQPSLSLLHSVFKLGVKGACILMRAGHLADQLLPHHGSHILLGREATEIARLVVYGKLKTFAFE